MTAKDSDIKKIDYDPGTYWESRARASDGNRYQAVCVANMPDCLNAAAETVQLHFLARATEISGTTHRRVMEFGSGVGRWVSFFESRNCAFSGVDVSETMIAYARQHHPDANFTLIDGVSLPFPDAHFDFVYSLTVLHHNPFNRQEEILKELLRVLRPGGHLLLMEDIAWRTSARTNFNMFLRTPEDWIALVTREPAMQQLDTAFIRWWITSLIIERFMARLYFLFRRRRLTNDLRGGPYGRFIDRMVRRAAGVDVFLHRWLPRRLAINAAMLFRKVD